MAKLKISVGRKIGRPGYGSVGCDLGVEIDLDETLFATEEDFAGEVARIGNKLRLSLTDELKKLVLLDAAEAAAIAEERRESEAQAREERQSYDRTPPTEERRERDTRETRRPPGNFKGRPKTGAGLFKALMLAKDDGDPEPMRRVDAWSKKRKLPGRWLDWEPEDVEEACEVAGL